MGWRVHPEARDIAARFPGKYTGFHSERYAHVLDAVRRHCRRPGRVLDVGASNLSLLLHETFAAPVDTLGFAPDGPNESGGHHYRLDLDDVVDDARRRTDLPRYDVVVIAEVIEHLHTSPTHVLGYLAARLQPGGVIVVQTPNAAALGRRVKLAMGRNPFDRINEDVTEPLHFREYTRREMVDYLERVGLDPVEVELCSYFDYRYETRGGEPVRPRWLAATQNVAYRALPPSLRAGMTVVARRPATEGAAA